MENKYIQNIKIENGIKSIVLRNYQEESEL